MMNGFSVLRRRKESLELQYLENQTAIAFGIEPCISWDVRERDREQKRKKNKSPKIRNGWARYPIVSSFVSRTIGMNLKRSNQGPLGDIHDIGHVDCRLPLTSRHMWSSKSLPQWVFVTSTVSKSRDREVEFECRSRNASQMSLEEEEEFTKNISLPPPLSLNK